MSILIPRTHNSARILRLGSRGLGDFVSLSFHRSSRLRRQEGLGRHVQGLGKSYITHRERITMKPYTIPVDQKEPKRLKQNETYIIFYRGIALRFQKQTLGDTEMTMFACAHQRCRSILAKSQSKPVIFLKGNVQLSNPLLNSCGIFVCGLLKSFVVNVRTSRIVNCGS